MKNINVFADSDGQSPEEIEIEEWYQENILYGDVAGSRVDFVDLVDWLVDHKSKVKEIWRTFG